MRLDAVRSRQLRTVPVRSRPRRWPEIARYNLSLRRSCCSASRCVARNNRSLSRPAACFDSTMWNSRATGTSTSSTTNNRRSRQTVSNSNPPITSVRSTWKSPRRVPTSQQVVGIEQQKEIAIARCQYSGAVERVTKRRSTMRSASRRSRGMSRGSSPAHRLSPAASNASQHRSRLSGSSGKKRSRSRGRSDSRRRRR